MVTTQVVPECESMYRACFRLVLDMKEKNQDKPLEESGGFALVFGLRVGLIRASS